MTDIFFSYSSKDRERVRPARDALALQGFDVFWDQEVPAGVDWDTWIRSHLNRSKCAIVFWSANSVASDNVRHEATVAKQAGKMVPVLIEELTAERFPMGLYSTQAANLAAWNGAADAEAWRRLQAEVEARLTPLWVTARLHEAEAAMLAERARRNAAESAIKSLREQVAIEAQGQRAAEAERDAANEKATALQNSIELFQKAQHAAESDRDSLKGMVEALQKNVQASKGEAATHRERAEQAETKNAALTAQVAELTERVNTRPASAPPPSPSPQDGIDVGIGLMLLAAALSLWPDSLEPLVRATGIQFLNSLGISAVPLALAVAGLLGILARETGNPSGALWGGVILVFAPTLALIFARHATPLDQWATWARVGFYALFGAYVVIGAAVLLTGAPKATPSSK